MSWAEIAAAGGQVLEYGPWALVLGLVFLLLRQRSEARPLDLQADKQRLELGIDMLKAAHLEIHRLNLALEGAQEWSDAQAHLVEAERVIGALIDAEGRSEVVQARRLARAFINRMTRLREARGVARNELQLRQSEERLLGDFPEGEDR